MPQSIIQRQQPKYWQGSIRWLTNTEKRKLRRQNIKDAGKWALSSIYNAITDLPSRLARIPAAWVDQIAWTDIQWAIEDLQSAPSQALKNSASNTKAFDKWSEAANALVWMAALLWAWRMWWTSNTVKNTKIPENVSKWFTRTELWDWYNGIKVEDMPAYAQKRIANMYNEAHPTWPKKANFAWVTREWELPNNGTYASYIPDKWQELADINKASKELWIDKDALRYEQDYLNNTKWWNWSIKETADYLKNTSRARAKAIKKRNMPAKERTARESWVTDFKASKVKPWTEILKWNDYPAFAQKRYNDWMESINWRPTKSEPEWLYYMWTKESAPNKWLKLTQENVKNNNILKQAWYSDEEIFSLTPSERAEIVNKIEAEYIETWPHADAVERWLYEFSDAENAAANTSRARAVKTKAKNMSAAERAKRVAAEEWASDSKWEIDAARAVNDAKNMSLEDMFKLWKSQQNW